MKAVKILISFVLILLVFASSSALAYAAEDTSASSRVLDRDDKLSSAEKESIYDASKEAESLTDIIFLVAIYDETGGIPSGSATVSSFGYSSAQDDVVLLIIECHQGGVYYYEMFTYGYAHTSLSDRVANRILDNNNVFDNIKSGNLVDGAVAFISETANELKGSSSADSGLDGEGIAVRVAIALAAGIISVVTVIVIYKVKLKSPIYPLSQFTELKLTDRSDIFIGKTVTRTKINTSSGSSSGGGSGGSRGRR